MERSFGRNLFGDLRWRRELLKGRYGLVPIWWTVGAGRQLYFKSLIEGIASTEALSTIIVLIGHWCRRDFDSFWNRVIGTDRLRAFQ